MVLSEYMFVNSIQLVRLGTANLGVLVVQKHLNKVKQSPLLMLLVLMRPRRS